jgi:hypothetical protein
MDIIEQLTETDNPRGPESPTVSLTGALTVLEPEPPGHGGLPEGVKPWASLWVSHRLRGNVTGALRQMSNQELRHTAATIALNAKILPHLLASWQLPQLEGPGFWVGTVLPAIKTELDRRTRPKRERGSNGPIARLKTLDIVDVASKFTQLIGNGDRLRGKCPIHQERTPSFYVYQDRQKWHCYGACGGGGDVIDLLRRLGDQGRLG